MQPPQPAPPATARCCTNSTGWTASVAAIRIPVDPPGAIPSACHCRWSSVRTRRRAEAKPRQPRCTAAQECPRSSTQDAAKRGSSATAPPPSEPPTCTGDVNTPPVSRNEVKTPLKLRRKEPCARPKRCHIQSYGAAVQTHRSGRSSDPRIPARPTWRSNGCAAIRPVSSASRSACSPARSMTELSRSRARSRSRC